MIERLLEGAPRPLRRSIEAIFAHPDRTLRQESHLVAVEELQDPDPDRLMELMADPTATRRATAAAPHFSTPDGGFCFSLAWDRRVRICYDTPANAELLRLLDLLRRDLRLAGEQCQIVDGAAPPGRATPLCRQLERWRQALLQLGVRSGGEQAHGGVVLEQDPRYREIRRVLRHYRSWRRDEPQRTRRER